jgi:putative transposase
MREEELVARSRRRFRRTPDSNHAFPVAGNVLGRKFVADGPDQAWVIDITYV